MEELEPENIEDLLQKLEKADRAPESPPLEVEERLQVLQSDHESHARRDAAEQLGKTATSSTQIVGALLSAYASDPSSMVNRAAARSLRAPVHQEYLQQHPDLLETTERALQQRPGADKQLTDTGTPSVPPGLETSMRRRWFAGGILASVAAYLAGVIVCGYLVEPWKLSLSEYLAILYDMYLGLSLCCGLPGMALSLLLLWLAVFRAKAPKRWALTVLVVFFAILNLVIGCGVGMFSMLDLSRY